MQCAKTLLIGAAAFALCATGTALAGSGTVRGEPPEARGRHRGGLRRAGRRRCAAGDRSEDERGHPLTGYDFVRDGEENRLGLPKGYPRPEDASDSKSYYDAVSKLASDIVGHMKTLAPASRPGQRSQPAGDPGPREGRVHGDRIFLAAAPVEDVDDLREDLAALLRASGCTVVPETNPVDVDEVHERAAEWISTCDKFVQVLGSMSGSWPHDNAGFVMYQHELAKKHNKPILVYRAPLLDISRVKKPEYREFIECFDQDEVGELRSFAEQVTRVTRPEPVGGNRRGVFMMASARDESLEREIRRLLAELKISVFPLERCGSSGREVAAVLDENSSFLNIVRRCGAILLINGSVKEENRLWVDDRVADIEFDIQQKLGGYLPYAIVDGPPPPRLEPREGVFSGDSPTLKNDLLGWLQTLNGRIGSVGGGLA